MTTTTDVHHASTWRGHTIAPRSRRVSTCPPRVSTWRRYKIAPAEWSEAQRLAALGVSYYSSAQLGP